MAWPDGVSGGLDLPCVDCGEVPRFDYRVTDDFWQEHVKGDDRLSVVCLPCLDKRCKGVRLARALIEVQWVGTNHTVVMQPRTEVRHEPLLVRHLRVDDRGPTGTPRWKAFKGRPG